jgi:hypothetical protein
LDVSHPKDSHVTIDQAKRFIKQLKDDNVKVSRLKVNGGDPVHNPDFEELIKLFVAETPHLFDYVKVQTAYPERAIRAKYDLPETVNLRCEPVDDKNYKAHHIPWMVSPAETGLLGPNDPPPFGSWATKKPCELQRRCGRSFERWGFVGCAQEAVLGRLLGIRPHSATYKHWANPDICKHCPMSLGREGARDIQTRADKGEFSRVSKVFDTVGLKMVYDTMPETHEPW